MLAPSTFAFLAALKRHNDRAWFQAHNMSAHIGKAGNKFQQRAGYYLHLQPGNCFLGGGAYRPDSAWLKAIRDAIAEDGKFFRRLLAAPAFKKEDSAAAFFPARPIGRGAFHHPILGDRMRREEFG